MLFSFDGEKRHDDDDTGGTEKKPERGGVEVCLNPFLPIGISPISVGVVHMLGGIFFTINQILIEHSVIIQRRP